MGIEIERKFLLRNDGWRAQVQRSQVLAQGYLNDVCMVLAGRQRVSVRVRVLDDAAFLNIKSCEVGHTRLEFDYPIPLVDARALLALCVGGRIEKTRHYVVYAGQTFEIDEFAGDNAGLIVAELELTDAAQPIVRPDWLGREVTDELRYYNQALAERPYTQWSDPERAEC